MQVASHRGQPVGAGNGPSLLEGSLAGVGVQRRYLWKSFRGKSNTIPGQAEKCSASSRNPVRLKAGIVFGIRPECCSASSRNPVRRRPESAKYPAGVHFWRYASKLQVYCGHSRQEVISIGFHAVPCRDAIRPSAKHSGVVGPRKRT